MGQRREDRFNRHWCAALGDISWLCLKCGDGLELLQRYCPVRHQWGTDGFDESYSRTVRDRRSSKAPCRRGVCPVLRVQGDRVADYVETSDLGPRTSDLGN